MIDVTKAALLLPEVDIDPEDGAADIFAYFNNLERHRKPTFVAYHNGKILATFTGGQHAERARSAHSYIHRMGFSADFTYFFSPSLSAVIWLPI